MANMAMCHYQMVVHQCTDFAAYTSGTETRNAWEAGSCEAKRLPQERFAT